MVPIILKHYLLSVLPTGFNVLFNDINNKLTLSYTDTFQINNTSTIYEIMGFEYNKTYTSTNNIISLPYCVNFNGIESINISFKDITTKNLDSYTKSLSNIIQNISVNSDDNNIIYLKQQDFQVPVKINSLNNFQIQLTDSQNGFINLNNCHWSITIEFSVLMDIPRFKPNIKNIINI